MTAPRDTLASALVDAFAACGWPQPNTNTLPRVADRLLAAGVRVAPSDKDAMEGVACDWDEDGNCRCVPVAPSPDAPMGAAAMADALAAWNKIGAAHGVAPSPTETLAPHRGDAWICSCGEFDVWVVAEMPVRPLAELLAPILLDTTNNTMASPTDPLTVDWATEVAARLYAAGVRVAPSPTCHCGERHAEGFWDNSGRHHPGVAPSPDAPRHCGGCTGAMPVVYHDDQGEPCPGLAAPSPDAPGLSPEAADVLLRWLVAGVAKSAPSDPATQEAIQYVITGRAERHLAALPPRDALDVERLRRAIYAVSVRHDWANTTDTEDRTEEIAREYAALALLSPDTGATTGEPHE